MTLAMLPLAWDLLVFFHNINFFGSASETAERMGALFAKSPDTSWFVFIGVFALAPAICEELLMRGMLTAAYRRVYSFNSTVIVIGLLFGLLHLYLARVPSTALAGMVLTYVLLRTGSIFLPMLMHLVFNGSLLVVANHAFFTKIPWIASQTWAPWYFVLPAAVVLIVCWRLIGSKEGDGHLRGQFKPFKNKITL
jgi:membrane protease YdiL (CAAX protease family)